MTPLRPCPPATPRMQELDAEVVEKLEAVGHSAAELAVPWLTAAFVGALPSREVLLLWDRVVGMDSLLPLAVLAAAAIIFRWGQGCTTAAGRCGAPSGSCGGPAGWRSAGADNANSRKLTAAAAADAQAQLHPGGPLGSGRDGGGGGAARAAGGAADAGAALLMKAAAGLLHAAPTCYPLGPLAAALEQTPQPQPQQGTPSHTSRPARSSPRQTPPC
jgi:hypothetical protein